MNKKLIESNFILQKKQDEDNQQPIETEQLSPKKATNKTGTKSGRSRKKSEAEKLQAEASGVNISFIFFPLIILLLFSLLNEQIKNPKQLMIQPKKRVIMNHHQRKKLKENK